MSQRSSLWALAVLAASAALVAGCSSSSSSSSSAATASAPAATTAAASPAASAPASTADSASKPSAADCKIINPIAAGVAGKLTPLESEPKAKAEAGMKSYIGELTADEAKLTSAPGKAALGAFIKSFEVSLTQSQAQATTTLTSAIGALGTVCA
jgi:hypothetical protein